MSVLGTNIAEKLDFRLNTKQIITNINKEFTCTICLLLYTDPVSLSSCQHTFCAECLKIWILNSNNHHPNSFECPLCKRLTNRRSYYSNQKYAQLIRLLKTFDCLIEPDATNLSKVMFVDQSEGVKILTENKLKHIHKYLDDFEKYEYKMCKEIITEESDNENKSEKENNAIIKRKSGKKIVKGTEANVNEKVDQRVIHNTETIHDQKNKTEATEDQKMKYNINLKNITVDGDISISSDEENDYINTICPTAEKNEIVKIFEDDFLDLAELEMGIKNSIKLTSKLNLISKNIIKKSPLMKNNSKVNKKESISTKTLKNESTSTNKNHSWRKIKKVNREINKKKGTYKKLKLTEPNTKRNLRSTKKEIILLDDFSEFLEKKQANKLAETVANTNSQRSSAEKLDVLLDILDEKIDKENDEDDIFSRCTQKLNFNDVEMKAICITNPIKRKSEENRNDITIKKSKTPEKGENNGIVFNKIIIDAEVHHSCDSEVNAPSQSSFQKSQEKKIESNDNKNINESSKKDSIHHDHGLIKNTSIANQSKIHNREHDKLESDNELEEKVFIIDSDDDVISGTINTASNVQKQKQIELKFEKPVTISKKTHDDTIRVTVESTSANNIKQSVVKRECTSVKTSELFEKLPEVKSTINDIEIIDKQDLINKREEIKENLKKVEDLKTLMITNLEQSLKMTDNIISDCSTFLTNSESLFSESNHSLGKHDRVEKNQEINLTNFICSAPNLDKISKESIQFYQTVIPYLKNIKDFYQQLTSYSEEFSKSSNIVCTNHNNTESIDKNKKYDLKSYKNSEAQTDTLKCPKCDYAFYLELNNTVAKNSSDKYVPKHLNVDKDFDLFLENAKNNLKARNLNSENLKDNLQYASPGSGVCKKAINRKLHFSGSEESQSSNKKRKFKRISTPPSDSDTESSATSKKSKNESYRSKLLYRDDIDIRFESELSGNLSNIGNNTVNISHNTKKLDDLHPDNKSINSQDPIPMNVSVWDKHKVTCSENIQNKNTNESIKKNNAGQQLNHDKFLDYDKCTLSYLEEQYKQPLEISQKNTIEKRSTNIEPKVANTVLENLFDGIDATAFDNDFTHENKTTPSRKKAEKTQQTASLFTENYDAKTTNNTSISNYDGMTASLFMESEKALNSDIKNKDKNQPLKDVIISSNAEENSEHTIVEDSFDSEKDIFEDDIVDNTPLKITTTTRETSKSEFIAKIPTEDHAALISMRSQDSERQEAPNVTFLTSNTPDILPLNNIDLNRCYFNNSAFLPASEQLSNQAELIERTKQPPTPKKNEALTEIIIIQNKNLNPIFLAQNEKFSPLQFIKPPLPAKKITPAKHQSSILSYVVTSQNNLTSSTTNDIENSRFVDEIKNERCVSPVLSRTSISVLPKYNTVITTSRLSVSENSEIMALISSLNARYSKTFNSCVTHLIVKADHNNFVEDQTMKYISSVAHGLWIVSYNWFKDCITQNRLLPEEYYEVLDSGGKPGPRQARLTRHKRTLLKNFTFYLLEPFKAASKAELEDVITISGGEVKNSLDELLNQPGKCCLVLADGKATTNYFPYQRIKETTNVLVVDVEWLGIVISQYELLSFREYILCLEDGIDMMGYPPELIAISPPSPSETSQNRSQFT